MSITAEEAKRRIDGLLAPHMGGTKPDYLLIDDEEQGRAVLCGNKETYEAGQKVYDEVMAVFIEYVNSRASSPSPRD